MTGHSLSRPWSSVSTPIFVIRRPTSHMRRKSRDPANWSAKWYSWKCPPEVTSPPSATAPVSFGHRSSLRRSPASLRPIQCCCSLVSWVRDDSSNDRTGIYQRLTCEGQVISSTTRHLKRRNVIEREIETKVTPRLTIRLHQSTAAIVISMFIPSTPIAADNGVEQCSCQIYRHRTWLVEFYLPLQSPFMQIGP